MESSLLWSALLFSTAGLFYVTGRLLERNVRMKEKDAMLASLESASRAFQNQLLVKQGSPPIFTSEGVTFTTVPIDDTPVNQILRPPFAQAELDWEEEDAKPLTVSDVFKPFVPELTQEQKDEMLKNYRG